ncbi:hypothetical protein CMV_012057 [Castanea mollissima]|uniref:Uncharacterized protein n=1 Tax=Castanea mollissima TaxID=60419 RepID=A0A8J4VJU6_9ROSI|nr:hypothetical protein CMV_012057 [Castanea mollissima]
MADDDVKDFYKLLKNISKSLEEMETVFKSASSSSNATTESLAVIKRFFNTSIDAALLDDAFLSQFKNAAERLVDKTSILGQDKNERLKNFNYEINSKVNNLRTAAEKEQKRTALKKARNEHVGTLQTYRSAFQPCRDEMQKMVTRHEALKKELRDYEKLMIVQMAPCKNVYSQQQSSIESEISAFQKNEQLLQQESQEIDKLRKEPSIDWSGLIAAFYN